METKMTKSIVYFDALSDAAKEKARQWYKEGNDMPFLKEYLTEFVQERLVKIGYEIQELKLHYSLAYCQGDGVSFDAILIKGKRMYTVKQRDNHYVHEMTMSAYSELYNVSRDGENERDEPVFLEKMRKLARETVKIGYEIQELKLHYSLAYCQGDGVSFDAILIKGKRMYTVKQRDNHYVHEMTMSAYSELYNVSRDGENERDEPVFLEKMRKLARETEKLGYAYIEGENDDENVDDNIRANEYTFTLDGARMNPDNA